MELIVWVTQRSIYLATFAGTNIHLVSVSQYLVKGNCSHLSLSLQLLLHIVLLFGVGLFVRMLFFYLTSASLSLYSACFVVLYLLFALLSRCYVFVSFFLSLIFVVVCCWLVFLLLLL